MTKEVAPILRGFIINTTACHLSIPVQDGLCHDRHLVIPIRTEIEHITISKAKIVCKSLGMGLKSVGIGWNLELDKQILL